MAASPDDAHDGMTMIAFSDLVSDTASQAGEIFTRYVDSAPEAFSSVASSLGERGTSARTAFLEAADGAADGVVNWAGSVRDGTSGFLDPTVLVGELEGRQLVRPLFGLCIFATCLVLFILTRLVLVLRGNLFRDDESRVARKHTRARAGSDGGQSVFFSARSLFSSLTLGGSGRDSDPLADDANMANIGDQQRSGGGDFDYDNDDLFHSSSNEIGAKSTNRSDSPLPPLRILGPEVTSLEFIASQPPKEVPSIFATARYRSIHRKLILDMRRLKLGRCNPQSHPNVEVTSNHDEEGTKLLINDFALKDREREHVRPDAASSSNINRPTSKDSGKVVKYEGGFEAQLQGKQTFGPPKLIDIGSVLNASAVLPTGCGSLELTLDVSDQVWEKQLLDDLTDPNKALAHIVTVESHQKELMRDFALDEGEEHLTTHDINAAGIQPDIDLESVDDLNPVTERGIGAPTVVPKENGVKNSGKIRDTPTKTTSEEYTFESARDAAEFQSVVLALRIVGKELRNMYSSLELLHMSSDAFDGEEFVLHVPSKQVRESNMKEVVNEKEKESEGEEDTSGVANPGVALDDVYRCLGEIPSVRRQLERFYRYHYPVDLQHHWEDEVDPNKPQNLLTDAAKHSGGGASDNDGGDRDLSPSDYREKRILLGLVDFLRLFLPPPDADAMPELNPSAVRQIRHGDEGGGISKHKARVVNAVTLRKRVARAAVRVQHYVNATKIIHKGWTLFRPPNTNDNDITGDDDESPIYRRRLAFDNDVENIRRDNVERNEYYEGTVGRDVKCRVHDVEHLVKKGTSRLSGFQGFSLVGFHSFQLPETRGSEEDRDHPLQAYNDPILALPSLRSIVEAHPEEEFFVQSFFSVNKRVALVMLFVRTLPRGVDTKFDSIIDTFANGNKDVRDRKLEVFLQLGPGSELPGSIWVALKVVNWMLRFVRRGEGDIPVLCDKIRTPFPGMRLSTYSETFHFGGSLQVDDSLPKNYVAATAEMDEDTLPNPIMRTLYNNLEGGALQHCVIDVSLVLEGQNAAELPERTLSTIRLVHLDAVKGALPLCFSSSGTAAAAPPKHASSAQRATLLLQGLASSTLNIFRIGRQELDEESRMSDVGFEGNVFGDDTESDPYKRDLDALQEILDGVTVPVRKSNVDGRNNGVAVAVLTPSSNDVRRSRLLSDVSDSGADPSRPQTPRTATGLKIEKDQLANVQVLEMLSRKDLTRYYLASHGNLREAAVRVVESSAWRGLTFPIDTRACRVELRSNQVVQYGKDFEGNPVFYFRNLLKGPWRKDGDATVLAVLHRVEEAMKHITMKNADAKCTVVVVMGQPILEVSRRRSSDTDASAVDVDDVSTVNLSNARKATTDDLKEEEKEAVEDKKEEEDENTQEDDDSEDYEDVKEKRKQMERNPLIIGADPRIMTSESYFVHTNSALIHRLVRVLSAHYPERLASCLVVPSGGWEKTVASLSLRGYVPSPRTRSRVILLNSAEELKDYISSDELLTFAGGKAVLPMSSFE